MKLSLVGKLSRIYIRRKFQHQINYHTQMRILGSTTSRRNKAFIHFLASTGVRVGATPEIRIEEVKGIEDGAVVTIYRDTTEEYRTCLTPEAYASLKKYLEQRIERNPDSVLFTRKNNLTPLTSTSAQDIVRNVRRQAKKEIKELIKELQNKVNFEEPIERLREMQVN